MSAGGAAGEEAADDPRAEDSNRDRGGRSGGGEAARKPDGSAWERALAAGSALLVLAAVGFMVYEGVTVPDTPPDLEFVADTVIPGGSGFLVRIEARNRGHATAASVVVEGTLRAGEEMLETAEVVIDYVPAGARRTAGLIFSRDPRLHSLEIRARGYDSP